MRTNGIVRRLDLEGRLVIPKEIKKKHDMNKGDEVWIIDMHNHIIIRKYKKGCIFCGSNKGIKKYKDVYVCDTCRNSISNNI